MMMTFKKQEKETTNFCFVFLKKWQHCFAILFVQVCALF